MIAKKPSILIYVCNPDQEMLREICAGIEEEGVLYEVVPKEGNADDLAFEAANDSVLGSGIGVRNQEAVLQMRGLKREKNLLSLKFPDVPKCRVLGANSARAIKKTAFKIIVE